MSSAAQVGSYLGNTGHEINVVVTAARGHAVRPKQVDSHRSPDVGGASYAALATRRNLCAEVLVARFIQNEG